VDALAGQGSISVFLSPEPVISISPCVGGVKGKEWLKERYFEHWAAAPVIRQKKLFIGRSSYKLSTDLMALDRKVCRLVNSVVKWPLYIGVAPICHGSLGKRQVQVMWTE
jgi:hypothetical protein